MINLGWLHESGLKLAMGQPNMEYTKLWIMQDDECKYFRSSDVIRKKKIQIWLHIQLEIRRWLIA